MALDDIPDAVLQFITRRIDSVPHLEALLLMWERPDVWWDENQLASRVYVSPGHAQRIMQDLAQHALIVADEGNPGRYRYDSGWDKLQLMRQTANTYRRNLVRVAKLIHAKTSSEAIRQFARAFELTKKKEE